MIKATIFLKGQCVLFYVFYYIFIHKCVLNGVQIHLPIIMTYPCKQRIYYLYMHGPKSWLLSS